MKEDQAEPTSQNGAAPAREGLNLRTELLRQQMMATYLVIDIRGWSDLVHTLGPEPVYASMLVTSFWNEAQPIVQAQGGRIFSWQGDALLAAFSGRRHERAERALLAAEAVHAATVTKISPQCWQLLRTAEARAHYRGEDRAARGARGFAVSSAVTDGLAIPVRRRFGDLVADELTGDVVNMAFDLVKAVPPGYLGIAASLHEVLRTRESPVLANFAWSSNDVESQLAAANRQVRVGLPAGASEDLGPWIQGGQALAPLMPGYDLHEAVHD